VFARAPLRGKQFVFPRYFTSLVKRSDILSFFGTTLNGFCYTRTFYQAAPFSEVPGTGTSSAKKCQCVNNAF
jgi:hypothetical protein